MTMNRTDITDDVQDMLKALLEHRIYEASRMLDKGADVQARDEYGNGPLHCLALSLDDLPLTPDMPDLVAAMAADLLQAGVDKEACNDFMQRPSSILAAHRMLMEREGSTYRFAELENMLAPSKVIPFRRV